MHEKLQVIYIIYIIYTGKHHTSLCVTEKLLKQYSVKIMKE